jgi:tRNA nucleotidyltransferase (CCA-adding enzyme)
MAWTIAQGFQKLGENLEITDLQASTVSTRQQIVRSIVASELTVREDFLTGSYMRNTMISPLSRADVDIFVVLDSRYFEANGQASLLDKVRRALRRTYRLSGIPPSL